jgi:hypothetical protein
MLDDALSVQQQQGPTLYSSNPYAGGILPKIAAELLGLYQVAVLLH